MPFDVLFAKATDRRQNSVHFGVRLPQILTYKIRLQVICTGLHDSEVCEEVW